jgi:four helix bundle protein
LYFSSPFSRGLTKVGIQFCRIARGSLCESMNQVITARDENYIDEDLLNNLENGLKEPKQY